MSITQRLGLPLLIPGQGQKDVTHNEALLALDVLVQPAVASAKLAAAPSARAEGESWIVPAGAAGDWEGMDHAIASWTAGGWRFLTPGEGYVVWVIDDQKFRCWRAGGWRQMVAIFDPLSELVLPSSGTVIDAEVRNTLAALISGLQDVGLIARN